MGKKSLDPFRQLVNELSPIFQRHVARFQQSCKNQLAYPRTVLLIRFVTRNVLDVSVIDYPHRESQTFEHLVHQFPVYARTLTPFLISLSFNSVKELLKVF